MAVPSTRTQWVAGIALAQVVALAATWPIADFGAIWWSHLASLAIVLGMVFLARRHLTSRRVLGIGVLVTSVLAVVSGFYLLYWKEGIREDGYQAWGVWWHVAWSWAAAVFFWQHTWVNRVAFMHFIRRSLHALAPAALHIGLYALAVAAFAFSFSSRGAFTSESYIPWSLWAWIVAVGTTYLAWILFRRRPHATRTRLRAGVDLALVPVAAVATLSGMPLLWFDSALDAAGLKYASKFWHVAPSIVFSVLVFVHTAQLWRTVRTHWRRLREFGPEPQAAFKGTEQR